MKTPATRPDVVELRGLRKSFGGTAALRGVDLAVAGGEIHGLLGANGSGKSTLIKVLAGYHVPDDGTLRVNGVAVSLPLRPGEAGAMGLSFVHQDLALVPGQSVAENLNLDRFVRDRGWRRIAWQSLRSEAARSFERYGLSIDPRQIIDELSQTERAMVAIVRAVEDQRFSRGGSEIENGLLVLDEPTVSLPEDGIARLFELMRDIASTGTGVLFVSHDLDEVRTITDRVTVLRGGEVCGQANTQDASVDDLAEMIVGRRVLRTRLAGSDAQVRATQRAPAVSVREVSGGRVRRLSFDLYPGEVVGLTGLAGSGCEDALGLLYGALAVESGTITLGDDPLAAERMTPVRALEAGIALIPGDRLGSGAVSDLSVTDNVTLSILPTFRARGRLGLRRAAMDRRARELAVTFGLDPPRPELPFSAFSGGNQQKALLAKWLIVEPRLLLLHEPTQGVDVGARQEIFRLIRETAARGTAVLCASLDYEQLAVLCERVLVLGDGKVTADLADERVTKDEIANEVYTSTSVQSLEG